MFVNEKDRLDNDRITKDRIGEMSANADSTYLHRKDYAKRSHGAKTVQDKVRKNKYPQMKENSWSLLKYKTTLSSISYFGHVKNKLLEILEKKTIKMICNRWTEQFSKIGAKKQLTKSTYSFAMFDFELILIIFLFSTFSLSG